MDCLNGFFALSKSCQVELPTSGLYIDSLEGISLKSLSNIVGAEKLTAQKLVDEKTQLIGELLKSGPSKYLFQSVVDHSVDSLISKDFKKDGQLESEAITRGLRLEKKRGKLTVLKVDRIYFKSATAVTALEITVTDGVNPKVYELTAEANEEIEIEANYSTNGLQIDITYDSETVEPYTGTVCPYNTFVDSDCIGCGGCKSLKIRAIEGDGLVLNYRGIRVDASVMCDREKMVCLIANDQKLPIMYLVGAEILKEWIGSDRINYITINSKEWAEKKIVEWEQKGWELLHENSQGIIKYLKQAEPKCFICQGFKYGFNIP